MPTTATQDSQELQYARPVYLGDLLGELVADAEDHLRAAAEGRARGPVSGLRALDHTIGGFFRPGIHGFTGDPGAGKTAVALQIAGDCGCPAVYVSAEQAPIELFRKHIARVTKTPLDTLRDAVPNKIRELATAAAEKAPSLLILDATSGPAPAVQIEGLAAKLRDRFEARNVLVVVDALQPWARGLGTGTEYDLIQAGLSDLVGITSRLKVPLLLLSHRNRASAGANSTTQTAAKGSADFEHLAESVIHLAYPKEGGVNAFNPGERTVNVNVAKNRHGPSDLTLDLFFNRELQSFRG